MSEQWQASRNERRDVQSDQHDADWEGRVAALARSLPYPPAPDLTRNAASRVQPRALRPAWAVAVVLLAMLAVLLAAPDLRAAVFRVIELGALRIFTTEGSLTPAPRPSSTASPASQATSGSPALAPQLSITATPAELSLALAEIAGQTTLEAARKSLPFRIALPTYPADLGAPNYVLVQEHAAPVVILVWTGGERQLSLWTFLAGSTFDKIEPRAVIATSVNGGRALWVEGEHMLLLRNGDYQARRIVEGHTLIWEGGNLTFRLETDLPLEEAIKVAESVE